MWTEKLSAVCLIYSTRNQKPKSTRIEKN